MRIDEKSVMFYVILYFLVPGTYVWNLNFKKKLY